MTDERSCITTKLGAIPVRDRPFPCRRKNLHWATCPDPDTCRGCVDRTATVGYLCPVCWGRTQDVIPKLAGLITQLRSETTQARALGERVSVSMEQSILIPDTWIAADDLLEAMGARKLPSTSTVDSAAAHAQAAVDAWAKNLHEHVNTIDGATQTVILLKRHHTALKRWPDSENELRQLAGVTCPNCHHPHLWRRAPRYFGDTLTVECGTPECGYVIDWDSWVSVYAPAIEQLQKDLAKNARKTRKETK